MTTPGFSSLGKDVTSTAPERQALVGSSSDSEPSSPVDGVVRRRYDPEAAFDDEDHDEAEINWASPSELEGLRKVSDELPWGAFLIAFVELCERFAFYGLAGPFQNYIANPPHSKNGLPGAIGLGQSGATAITTAFSCWGTVTPIAGAIIADQYWGKFITIKNGALIYMLGALILVLTSFPWAIERGLSLIGLLIAVTVIGLGGGGIKPNVSPLIAEQYRHNRPRVSRLPTGERVVIDPAMTIQRIYMFFYLAINVGSLSSMATTILEKNVGFWAAFALPFCAFVVGYVVFVSSRNRLVLQPPQGSVVTHCFQALGIAIRQGGLDAARPGRGLGSRAKIAWDDAFIDELKQTMSACRVFLFFPIYWVCYIQMVNNFISQAGQMELHGIPNDLLQTINPIAIIVLIPLMDRYGYPFLRRMGYPLRSIARIAIGFFVGAMAMFYAALIQRAIYAAPPCFTSPGACSAGQIGTGDDATIQPNQVNVLWQCPAYALIALSEIFASVTGLEYAFTQAPVKMKSFVMALFMLTNAVGAVCGMLLAPWATDPYLTSLYTFLGVVCALAGCVFWFCFRRWDVIEDRKVNLAAAVTDVSGGLGEQALALESVAVLHAGDEAGRRSGTYFG